jgi:hypothetical protein
MYEVTYYLRWADKNNYDVDLEQKTFCAETVLSVRVDIMQAKLDKHIADRKKETGYHRCEVMRITINEISYDDYFINDRFIFADNPVFDDKKFYRVTYIMGERDTQSPHGINWWGREFVMDVEAEGMIHADEVWNQEMEKEFPDYYRQISTIKQLESGDIEANKD